MLDQHLFLPVTILMPCILLKEVKLSGEKYSLNKIISLVILIDSVVDSVPYCLVELVLMIEHGPDIKSQIENGLAKSDFAIAQLLYFNNHKKGPKTQVNTRDIQVTANHLLLFM